MSKVVHKGGCHCGAVAFEVQAPATITALHCNCSICAIVGFNHLIVEKADFKLLSGTDQLTSYKFNTKMADHLFCSVCGVKSFYIPRSHPDGYSVDVNCLDMSTIENINQGSFDGKNWEANVGEIT